FAVENQRGLVLVDGDRIAPHGEPRSDAGVLLEQRHVELDGIYKKGGRAVILEINGLRRGVAHHALDRGSGVKLAGGLSIDPTAPDRFRKRSPFYRSFGVYRKSHCSRRQPRKEAAKKKPERLMNSDPF